MIRPVTISWMAGVLVLGVALYQIKHRVQALEENLDSLNREILANQEAIHVLNAEWSYLNEPGRLAALNDKYLHLRPVTAGHLQTMDQLPPHRDEKREEKREEKKEPAADGAATEAAP